jgi:hypothetical protein
MDSKALYLLQDPGFLVDLVGLQVLDCPVVLRALLFLAILQALEVLAGIRNLYSSNLYSALVAGEL